MGISDEALYKLLKKNNYLSREQLEEVQKTSLQEGISFQAAVLEKSLIGEEDLTRLIADYLKLPYVVLTRAVIPNSVLEIIPEEVAKRNKIIAFELTDKTLKIATCQPENEELIDFIGKRTDYKIKVYYASVRDIDDALGLYKRNLKEAFERLMAYQSYIKAGDKDFQNAPISKILDLLVDYAYYHRASDIHIEPRKENSVVRFRIDGILHHVLELEHQLHELIITRIKVLSDLRTDEHFSAQDGKMQVAVEGDDLDIRVSVVPIVQGEKAVLRLLSSKNRQFSLSDLGISPKELGKLDKSYQKPYGMILVTGPTGSGKTTTIYAILKILNTPDKNIATIEDPVEYEIEGTNQIHVNPKTNLTFALGLRSILRQDPNIIFVGEIRDEETADIAVNSAMTGHLVLSTLHTNDSSTAFPRLLDMKIEPFLISSTVSIVVGQRLVRTVCTKCRFSTTIERDEVIKNFPTEMIDKYFPKKKTFTVYQGKGCPICNNTGFLGRVGIFEFLEVTKEIRELINQKADSEVIKKQAIKEGMMTMLEDGLIKVQKGVTTMEEVLRATKE